MKAQGLPRASFRHPPARSDRGTQRRRRRNPSDAHCL